MSMVNGAFDINGTQVTFYKRDGSTPLTVINTTPTGRTRIS
jgi:hypothetical protein